MIDIFSFATALLDTIFPPRCLVCSVFLSHSLDSSPKKQDLDNYLCDACRQQLQISKVSLDASSQGGGEHVFSAYLYAGLLEKIIPPWKYHDRHEFFPLIKILLKLAWSRHEFSALHFDLILAVPLTPLALRKRGFNQAFFIASCSAAFLEFPLACNLLLKTIDTPRQASLDRRARTRNVSSDLFLVPEPEKIRGKNILLCDDVLTTGTTLSAAAKVLKDAGANSISGFTLARVLL